jgi:hypothetical protein
MVDHSVNGARLTVSLEPGVNTRYSLAEGMAITGVKEDLDRLSAVDDLWTAYLAQATVDDVTSQGPEFDQLASRMIDELEKARGGVERLRGTLEGISEDEIEFALSQVESEYPELYGSARDSLAELLEEYSVRGAAIEACSFLELQLPNEIDAVAEKRRRLADGEFQPGDMSPPARCALSGAKLGLATALIVVTGGAAAPIVLGAALGLTDFAENWKKGCGVLAGGVWTRLRGAG